MAKMEKGEHMKYTIEKKENSKVAIELKLTTAEWEAEIESAYQKMKGKFNIQGFRKGKAPKHVIEKFYGKGVFLDEALNSAFSKYYAQVLDKEKTLEVVEQPTLDVKSLDDKGMVMVATVTVSPEVKLGAYTGLGVVKKEAKVTQKQVEDELKAMLEDQARFVEVDREIKEGDTANIDFSGSIDGKKFEGGTATGYDLAIGSHSFIEGFEEQLVGLKRGDKKDVKVTFPSNYHVEELKNKPAVFAVSINAVKEKQLPELNDEFASTVSEFETVKELKEHTKEHLLEHAKEHADREFENNLIEAIVKNMEVKVPECMIESELDRMLQDMNYRLMYQGITLDDYVKYMNITIDDLKKQEKKNAEHNVKVRLALRAIIEKEKLDVTKEDIDARIKEQAKANNRTIKDEKASLDDHAMMHLQNDILMDKVFGFLASKN